LNSTQKIKELIKKNGKTQQDLADEMGINKRTLDTKFYRGGFYADELIKIADWLGFKVVLVNDEEKIVFDVAREGQ
jgi:transcriptional regulator with XRE-family HTH domain